MTYTRVLKQKSKNSEKELRRNSNEINHTKEVWGGAEIRGHQKEQTQVLREISSLRILYSMVTIVMKYIRSQNSHHGTETITGAEGC